MLDTIILLSIALAMDAFSIALTLGISGLSKRLIDQLKIAFTFGFFQSFLFLLGILGAIFIGNRFSTYNKYIAAILLLILGIKMLKDALEKKENTCIHRTCRGTECKKARCDRTGEYRFLTLRLLLIYGTATSIDAFASGIAYALKNNQYTLATVLIGIITFILSYVGALSGLRVKKLVGNKANLLGGVILIILAIKSLI